jgi:hypothetical protein
MFQTLLKSFWLCSFWKRPDWSQKDLEPDLCFSTLVHVGKMGSGSKPFLNHFHPFHFERGQTVSKWDWNLASAFPLWSVLKNWGQVPNFFTNHVVFCSFRKAPNWSQRGLELDLCFSTLVRVGTSCDTFLNHLGDFHFERGQAGPKGVWNLTSAFPLWSMLEKLGSGSKPF